MGDVDVRSIECCEQPFLEQAGAAEASVGVMQHHVLEIRDDLVIQFGLGGYRP